MTVLPDGRSYYCRNRCYAGEGKSAQDWSFSVVEAGKRT